MKTMFKRQLKFYAYFFCYFIFLFKPTSSQFVKSFLFFFVKNFSTTINRVIDTIFFMDNNT